MREWVDIFVLCYFIGLNAFYATLIAASMLEIARRNATQMPELDTSVLSQESTPPITVIAPAYNEEQTIVDSVRAFLHLEYPRHQVLVVNDGSRDRTLQKLIDEYDLEPIDLIVRRQIPTKPVRAIYQSRKDARLYVVDKENGGKADALNVGVNTSRYPLVCCADADTIVTKKALLRMVEPYLYDPRGVVAVGGTIRLANGCHFLDGVLQKVDVPSSWLARFQIIEYLRGFLFGRMGLNRLGGNLIISGAFGLFRRDAIIEVGGYAADSVGEDMEIVVKLQSHVLREDPPRKIVHISDPIAYTEAPESLELLMNQRDRWHRGMADAMWRHKGMLLNPRYGLVGMVVYPAYLLFELLGPVVELFGYIWFGAGLIFGFVDVKFALLFLVAAFWLGALMSIQALLIDNWGFDLFRGARPRLKLLLAAIFENLGYRQLTLWFRLKGLVKYLFGAKSWGKMTRKGFAKAPSLIVLLAALWLVAGCHESAQAAIRQHLDSHQNDISAAKTHSGTACSTDFIGALVDVERYGNSPRQRQRDWAARRFDALRAQARRRAENSLKLVNYPAAASGTSPALAILSFPDPPTDPDEQLIGQENPADNPLARRSYVYDMALGLLWFSWTGQGAQARGLAQTLYFLQKDDGSWGFSFHVDHPDDYHARFVRSGTVAWAAHALTYFATRYAEPAALLSARRAARFLRAQTIHASGPNRGLISAGLGLPSTLADDPPDTPIALAPTEHQFDAQMALTPLDPPAARKLGERIIDVLWMGAEGRFAVAADATRVDTRRALDAAGAWGALWLLSTGQPERAWRSFDYARQTFATTYTLWDANQVVPKTLKLQGFRPYEDDIDEYDPQAEMTHFFLEGTFSMGLAARRLGAEDTAQTTLLTGVALSCASPTGGLPYSNIDLPGFLARPAAASTLWFLFLERELTSNEAAPLFPDQRDWSGEKSSKKSLNDDKRGSK